MIPTSNHSARYGGRVRMVALHTTEGATDVDALGAFFRTGTKNASYHGAFDDERYESFVNYSESAWALRSGNGFSDNAAFCCAAVRDHWSADDWMRHPRMLELGAAWTADRCLARQVPIRRLSLAEVRACKNDPNHPGGIIMHRDWTLGAPDGSHTDCGDAFVWDWFLNRVRQIARVGPAPADPIIVPGDEIPMWLPIQLPPTPASGDAWWYNFPLPVGVKSQVIKAAWISAIVNGGEPGWVKFWFQDDDSGIRTDERTINFRDGRSDRPYVAVPDGNTQVRVQYRAKQGAALGLELKPH